MFPFVYLSSLQCNPYICVFYYKLVKYVNKLYIISNFIIKHNIINKNQYGFIPKYNTTILLFNIHHYISHKNSENNKIATICRDLKKAFDIVDHVIKNII